MTHNADDDMFDEFLSKRTVHITLIFHKQEVSFGILAEDLYGLLCHLHNGGVSCAVPENLKSHVLWLKQTWSHTPKTNKGGFFSVFHPVVALKKESSRQEC